MNGTACRPATVAGTPFNLMLVYTYGIDIVTYVLNIILVVKIRRGNKKIQPLTVTQRTQAGKPTGIQTVRDTAGGSSSQQRARQNSITRSVIGAVGLHFLFTTAPFISTPLIMIGSRAGE